MSKNLPGKSRPPARERIFPHGWSKPLTCKLKLGMVDWGCKVKKEQEVIASPKSAQQPQQSEPHFSLDPDKLRTLCDRVAHLGLGQTRDEVRALVGPSDREDLLGPKKARDWSCRSLVYEVSTIDSTPGNVRDRRVALVFDRREDKLIAILSN